MRRASTRLLVSASATLVLFLGTGSARQASRATSPKKVSELTLAGMRPGRDTVARAPVKHMEFISGGKEDLEYHWRNICRLESLIVTTEKSGKVSEIRVTEYIPPGIVDCADRIPPSRWKTGRGLGLHESADRVVQLYGKPDSVSPSTKGGQQLELWYYAFDWAGPDVPQVMEVVCTVGKDGEPGRVVEITLAASSL